MIAHHGQRQKYLHETVGCNSRLDTLQAAILDVKLTHLDRYEAARYGAAQRYTQAFQGIAGLLCPIEESYSTHVYHQYTLRVSDGRRDDLQSRLRASGIPSMIYYPLPLHRQEAYRSVVRVAGSLVTSERLCKEVLSLPMHTELIPEVQQKIVEQVRTFFKTDQ